MAVTGKLEKIPPKFQWKRHETVQVNDKTHTEHSMNVALPLFVWRVNGTPPRFPVDKHVEIHEGIAHMNDLLAPTENSPPFLQLDAIQTHSHQLHSEQSSTVATIISI